MDEMSRQLLQQVRAAIEMPCGALYWEDHHYRRNGTASLFTFFEQLARWRTVMTRKRQTKVDWARCIRTLLIDHYPTAKRVVMIMDKLEHPSSIDSLRGVRASGSARPCRAPGDPVHARTRKLAGRGGIEQSVFAQKALSRQFLADRECNEERTTAWQGRRNTAEAIID